jgi:hypothetical protein
MPREDGQFTENNTAGVRTQFQPGNRYRFPRVTSGNLAGVTATQAEFNHLLAEAMRDPARLQKALAALDKSLDAGEAWAAQWWLNRVMPAQPVSLKLSREVDDGIDWSKLTDAEIEQMERILERASKPVAEIESGEGPAEPL